MAELVHARWLAEFADDAMLAAAIRELKERGVDRIDAYMPYPSHTVEEALHQPPSRLPWVVAGFGLLGVIGAYALQWILEAYLYPLIVGGRPPHFPLAFVIITFEMGVLFASGCAFFGTLVVGRLVRLVDDVQGRDGFESVTRDHFWLDVSRSDEHTPALLVQLGATHVVPVEAP